MNDHRGSIWRKWDLHFHTPSSYDYLAKSVTNQNIIDILKSTQISAVAITDHHVIDVDRIRELKHLAGSDITIFPGIELRSELGGSESIHYIGIFPEDADIETIWTKMQGPLSLTPSDVAAKGDDRVYCILKKASELIHALGGIVSIHSGSKSNTIENITNALSYKEAIKEDILELIDIFEMGNMNDFEVYKKHVLPNIRKQPPMIICSDSHNVRNYVSKGNLWIKADLSFQGLQQILYEPTGRVFPGDIPLIFRRVNANSTKYIKSVRIDKREDADYEEETWFQDISIELNPELIAIIGNKGNGKSALADIIGLAGNSKNYNSFSFLRNDKFRDPKNNKAKHFEVTIEWISGDTDNRCLAVNPEDFEYEKIKYFPQKYLEILCNDELDEFEKELKKVIFSHVPDEEKLGVASLDELMQYHSESIEGSITILKDELSALNREITMLEDTLDDSYKKTLDEQLKSKVHELDVHENTKPSEMKKPDADETVEKQVAEINEKIRELQTTKATIEKDVEEAQKKKSSLLKQKSAIIRILGEIANFQSQYVVLSSKIDKDLKELGIKLSDIVSFEVKTETLKRNKESLAVEIDILDSNLNPEVADSLPDRLSKIDKEIEKLRKKLDEPNKRYQEYIKQLHDWEIKKKEMIGDKEIEGSIEYLKQKNEDISSSLPKVLTEKKENRLEIARRIYRKKKELVDIYKTLYKPVESFIAKYRSEKYPVGFDVSFEIRQFQDNFFFYVNQKVRGSFLGLEEGSRRLREAIDSTNFNDEEDVINFLRKLIEALEFDLRDEKKEKRTMRHQMKKDMQEFYDFIFSLDYLVPQYTLKLGETELSQLSPGEKGALLLIFYLLIDKNDIPLVMDQPEENLDNQSVYELLVHYIKEAKKKRQIIIVTHNPNLAVVCDAEQIIYARIDKIHKNTVSYETGSIENPTINRRIIDVLEGTMPAFNNRDIKYDITRKLTV